MAFGWVPQSATLSELRWCSCRRLALESLTEGPPPSPPSVIRERKSLQDEKSAIEDERDRLSASLEQMFVEMRELEAVSRSTAKAASTGSNVVSLPGAAVSGFDVPSKESAEAQSRALMEDAAQARLEALEVELAAKSSKIDSVQHALSEKNDELNALRVEMRAMQQLAATRGDGGKSDVDAHELLDMEMLQRDLARVSAEADEANARLQVAIGASSANSVQLSGAQAMCERAQSDATREAGRANAAEAALSHVKKLLCGAEEAKCIAERESAAKDAELARLSAQLASGGGWRGGEAGAEIERLRADKRSLSAKAEAASIRVTQVMNDLEDTRMCIATLETELNYYKEQNSALSKQLDVSVNAVVTGEKLIKRLGVDLDEQRAKYSEAEKRMEELEGNAACLSRERADMLQELVISRDSAATMRAERDAVIKELEAERLEARTAATKLSEQLGKAVMRAREEEAAAARATAQVASLKDARCSLVADAERLSEEAYVLKGDIKAASESSAMWEASCVDLQSKLDEAEDEARAAEGRAAEYKDLVESLKLELATVQEDAKAAAAKIDWLRRYQEQQAAEATKRATALEDNVSTLQGRVKELEDERVALSASLSHAGEERQALCGERDAIASERDSLVCERHELLTEKEELCKVRDTLSAEMIELKASLEAATRSCGEKDAEIEVLTKRLSDVEVEREDALERIGYLEKRAEVESRRIESMKSEVQGAREASALQYSYVEASKAELERTREENKALEEENRLLAMRASSVEEEAKKQRGSKMYAEHERLRRERDALSKEVAELGRKHREREDALRSLEVRAKSAVAARSRMMSTFEP